MVVRLEGWSVCCSNSNSKQSVISGLGISFVSLHTIGNELNNGQIAMLDIEDTPVMCTWHVVVLNKRNTSQVAEAFRYFVLEKGAEILNEMFKHVTYKK